MAQLVWAAVTIGTTPFGPRLRAGQALELQWRSAMMRAAIEPVSGIYSRSTSYNRLDPAEKGAVSFFLGQAQAKVFAHDFFGVSRFVHLDAYLAHLGAQRSRTRPDFIGFHGRQVAIATEVKGRSNGYTDKLVTDAKKQACNLPQIVGHPTSATYAHVAHFSRGEWRAHLEDPPHQRRAAGVDPAMLTVAYYLPVVRAIRSRAPDNRRFAGEDAPYLAAYFAEADFTVSVRADIAERVPVDDDSWSEARPSRASALYEWVLRLDEAGPEAFGRQSALEEDDFHFLGRDGVLVELGSSWRQWNERALG
ncbi:hypothetical protein [Streptomyces sp. M92]|uniref:hypothetical protein n=1 Tax=Streptomyces sp. M92 TaxID=2944250 RepID=UPI00234B903A|nr:hypothetical protein [Streptomyces sp. M92]WCN07373.1 hypothetical protein M6G08_35625 [Streptomyces sp. M92]